MLLAYVDESGNSGPIEKGGTRTFTLGCVIVDANQWPDRFERLLKYRRHLKQTFGVPLRAEIKANYLLRNSGPFAKLKLSEKARFAIYRDLMRLLQKLELRAFAVVVHKHKINSAKMQLLNREVAWEYLLQRLERLTTTEDTPLMLLHDHGEGGMVRALARKARRIGTAGSAFGTGYLNVPCTRIIDDPIPRESHQSYFIQLADLCAYAAFRKLYPPPAHKLQIVPEKTWDELGAAIYSQANYMSGGPAGIVSWPK